MVPWAIVPAAGRGSRLLPVTAAVPKVLLPLGSRPMLHWAMQEAIDAGVTGVIVVVSPEQPTVRRYVEAALQTADEVGGESPAATTGAAERGRKRLAELGRRLRDVDLRFVEQPEPRGVGDAFLRCRGITGDEPFCALLPDNWFDSATPCVRQLIPTFRQTGDCTLALTRVSPDDAARLGNVGAVELESLGGRAYRIRGLQDKGDGTYRATSVGAELRGCARYMLTPEFYRCLEATGPPERGEWDDVPAFQRLVSRGRLAGHRVDGRHFDLGQPDGYLAAAAHLERRRREEAGDGAG